MLFRHSPSWHTCITWCESSVAGWVVRAMSTCKNHWIVWGFVQNDGLSEHCRHVRPGGLYYLGYPLGICTTWGTPWGFVLLGVPLGGLYYLGYPLGVCTTWGTPRSFVLPGVPPGGFVLPGVPPSGLYYLGYPRGFVLPGVPMGICII